MSVTQSWWQRLCGCCQPEVEEIPKKTPTKRQFKVYIGNLPDVDCIENSKEKKVIVWMADINGYKKYLTEKQKGKA